MTKEITLKFIDNQTHGYTQVSKYDLRVGILIQNNFHNIRIIMTTMPVTT